MNIGLKKFDKMCKDLFFEQVTCSINGEKVPVEDNGDGNITVKAQTEVSDNLMQQQIATTSAFSNETIENLISFLTKELDESIKAARAAKTYSKYNNDDIERVKFNQGFAEGKKYIIRMVLKQLTNMEMTENETM